MDRGRTAKPSFDDDASGCCCLENIIKIGLTPDRPVYMDKRHKKRAACERLRRSGLIGFLFHDKNPLGSGLASGGPFPRSRKLSGAQLAFTGPNWAQWL